MGTQLVAPPTELRPGRSFEEFLDAHLGQEMLRFTTAGSVDDGKSTLIGRLLHDTKSVYEDQLLAVKKSRVNRAANGHVDFSLLTDGLKAEREQGITIDVAYRYFSTARRKFIIADTPGHEQYTRNMATGASTADVAIILIDAKAFAKAGGLLPQSRRHTYIASLLGIPHIVAAVNKMDLVGYSRESFNAIRRDFEALCAQLGLPGVEMIPVSALEGDNVVTPSAAMPWYEGPTLLEYLETVPLALAETTGPMRFPVQLVLRPDANFRGFAGQVARGTLRAGERVMALPSRRETTVSRIVTYDGDLAAASYPQSITVELEDEIDLSRGEMLVAADPAGEALPEISNRFRAMVVWMHEDPLLVGRTYFAKHTTRTVRATVRAIRYRVDVNDLHELKSDSIAMNEIAEVEFETNLPLFFDSYRECRGTGSLILIDALTNATVGAAMIVAPVADSSGVSSSGLHRTSLLVLPGKKELAVRVQDALLARGERAVVIDDPLIPDAAIAAVVRALDLAGVAAISTRQLSPATLAAIEVFAHGDVRTEVGTDEEAILKSDRGEIMNVIETVTNFETLTAEALVEQVVNEAAGEPICLTSSFQTEDMVVLHMLRQHIPDVPVIFLETGYHFAEVLAYRDRMAAEWGLNLVNALPLTTLAEHEAQYGLLHIVQPTECCRIRKVEPLMRSLEPFDWWFTGLRREQSPTRAGLRKVEDHKTPTGKQMKKVSVLADWTMAQVNEYADAHGIPKLELYARGYTSIGCEPCTAIPEDPANPRAGRWGGKKLECGIHTFSEKV